MYNGPNSAQHSALLQVCHMHSASSLRAVVCTLSAVVRTLLAATPTSALPAPSPIATHETLSRHGAVQTLLRQESLRSLSRQRFLCHDRKHYKACRDREFSVATELFCRVLGALLRLLGALSLTLGALSHPLVATPPTSLALSRHQDCVATSNSQILL